MPVDIRQIQQELTRAPRSAKDGVTYYPDIYRPDAQRLSVKQVLVVGGALVGGMWLIGKLIGRPLFGAKSSGRRRRRRK